MSSHREAPEISKDPVADSTDTYAFVSPDRPDTVTTHRQLHPARGPRRRPELLRVRRRRALPDPHRQRRRRPRRHHLPVPLHDARSRNPNTFLYNTGPITVARQPELEPAADLHGHRDRRGKNRAPGRSATNLPCPPCNIGPRSTPNYAGLASGRDPHARRRRQGVRRPARRRLLRRPRLDLRPRATCGRSRTCT